MILTALEALNLAAPIADAYMSVEERLLVRIARQLSLNDDHQLNEASKWQIKQLAKHGMLRQDAHKIIAAGTKGIPGNVAETVRQAIDDTLAEDGIQGMWQDQRFAESAANAVKHYRNQAKDVYNQVNTVMKYKAESTFVRAVNTVAEKWTQEQRREQSEIANKQDILNILNSNTASVVSGAESRTKAVRTTIHASFWQAYGIDLVQQQGELHWCAFQALFDGLPDDTPIRRIMRIRTEEIPPLTRSNAKQIQSLTELKTLYRLPDTGGNSDSNAGWDGLFNMMLAKAKD